MILTKTIEINLGSRTRNYYARLGYEIPKMNGDKKSWKLVVDVEDLPKTSGVKLEVLCENCGEIREVRQRDLHRARTKTKLGANGATYCGNCSRRFYAGEKSPWYKHGNPLYSQYERGAKRRGLEWSLSVDSFMKMNTQPCHYCGGTNEYSRSMYTGNGIDRKDNSKGYTDKNTVPCCTICNRAKHAMGYNGFKLWIERLVENNVKAK